MPLDDPWISERSIPIVVCRFDGETFEELPHVRCTSIVVRDGVDPGRAAFLYELDSGIEGAPTTIEEALSTASSGPLIVEPGDELVVRATRPDGVVECLFHGVALDFGLELAPEFEGADFAASGIAVRCLDRPFGGALMRDAVDPSAGNDAETDLPAHFNPEGRPNASPDGEDSGDGPATEADPDRRYPAFIDPLVVREPEVRRAWTLAMAARHLIFRGNPDEEFVANPDGRDLDDLLVAREPIDGVPFDPADPATYTKADILVRNLPITGKDWPGTLQQMVGDVGFVTRYVLETDEEGLPSTRLEIAEGQSGELKHLYLAPRGSDYDPTTSNLASASLRRDLGRVANSWEVRGAPERYEASFVLAPGFPAATADGATSTAIGAFDRSSDAFTTNRNKYRLFVFDETGEGHYAVGTATRLTDAPSLDALLGADKYANRRRRPIGELISLDDRKRPFRARLAISTNYAGPKPGLWDGTGTWQVISSACWLLLSDRLGIELTPKNPNSWEIGPSSKAGAPYPAGMVKVVEALCGASGAVPCHLRLTVVVEGDQRVKGTAGRRDASPLPWEVARVIDADDRLRKLVVAAKSEFNATADPVVKRDDSDAAKAEASAIRAACESGVLQGSSTIPRLTAYYKVGDRIASIEGRDLGFRTDGSESDSEAIYPVVTGVRWDLLGFPKTTLELSDAGADRAKYDRRVRGRHGRG